MYARLQTAPRTRPPAELAGRPEDLLDVIGGHPGFAGAWLLSPVAADAAGLLTLWQTREDAERAPDRTAAVRGARPVELAADTVYRVVADHSGAGAETDAGYAQLTCFDAPRSPEWSEAFHRAGQERVWPSLRDLTLERARAYLVATPTADLQVALVTDVEAVQQLQAPDDVDALWPCWRTGDAYRRPDRPASCGCRRAAV